MIGMWIYLIGALLSVVPLARAALAPSLMALDPAEPEDVALAVMLGIMLAWFWPLVIFGLFVYRAIKPKPEQSISLDKQ